MRHILSLALLSLLLVGLAPQANANPAINPGQPGVAVFGSEQNQAGRVPPKPAVPESQPETAPLTQAETGLTPGQAAQAQDRPAAQPVAAQPDAQPVPPAPTSHSTATAASQAEGAKNKPAYLTEDQPFTLKDYDEPKAAAPTPWWQQALGFIIKLVLVIGLVFLSLTLLKKFSGGRIGLALPNTKGRNLVVLESTHLTPQQAVHLISLGGDRLLVVGATPQSLTPLAEITDPLLVRHYMQTSKISASQFNQVFDLESVVQDNSELFNETLRDVRDPKRKGWPRA